MRILPALTAWLLLVTGVAASRGAQLRVVATLPELAAIAESVGGDLVKVETLARATEDPHFVDARPSFVRILNKADALIEGGADLESGWLPPLVQSARNRKIQTGQSGRIVASTGLALLDVPTALDRSQGDVHAKGNPHYLLDPTFAGRVAATIARGFAEIDAAHAADYQKRAAAFDAAVAQKMVEWKKRLAPCEGVKVITYHKSFDYFIHRFGFALVNTIEPKPGIEPSPSHVAHLIQDARPKGVRLVIAETFRPSRTCAKVAEEIGAAHVSLPITVTGVGDMNDYISWIDHLVKEVARHCAVKP